MTKNFQEQFHRIKRGLDHARAQLIVRVWNLAKRLDPRTMKEEKKKKSFSKIGNKGK